MFISYGVYYAYMNEPDEPYSTTVRISSDVLEEIRQFKRVTESIGDTIARITREWQILRTIRQIEHWDRDDIRDLRNAIQRLDMLDPDKQWSARVDWANLPSEFIPDTICGYPVWAMDRHGLCLVGDAMDGIEHINEILEWYKNKKR